MAWWLEGFVIEVATAYGLAMTGLRRNEVGQVLCSFSCSQTLISDW